MIICRGLVFESEDDAYEYFRQREVDQQDALLEAHVAGRQAGLIGTAAGANPYDLHLHPDLYSEWEKARSAVEARARAEDLKRRARRSCEPCTCGGRGLCLADAA